jgi:hypothetical protein
MSLDVCLARLEAEGIIDAERANRFRSEYERLNTAYGKTMGKAEAAAQATADAMDALEHQAAIDRRQKLLQIDTQRRILTGLVEHVERGGRAGQYAMALADHHEAVPGVLNMSNRSGAIRMLAWSKMDGYIANFKRTMLGTVSNKAELENVARALRGEAVSDANAQMLAKSIGDTFEWLRLQFNRAGGNIPKLKNWGMPQSHDALAITKAGPDEWKAFIRPLIDPSQMIDNSTGKAFASEEAIDEALDAVWRTITSEGLDGHVPGMFTTQGKIANRRTDHRFLVFKDSDAWLTYNERFGNSDLMGAMTGHIDGMARDIAAMQVLGPNPALTVRWLGDIIKMDNIPSPNGGKPVRMRRGDRRGAKMLDLMYRNYMGTLALPDPENRAFARFWSGVRNWNVTSKLGGAYVSAQFTDPVFMAINAKFNGLAVTKVLGSYFKAFNPADASHRAAAEHAGLVMTELTTQAERMSREGHRMRFNTHEFTRRAADATLRATFLTPHTVAAKQAVGLGFMKEWAELAGKGWAELGDGHRMAFERHNIDAADWDLLRSTAIENADGPVLLRPSDLAKRADLDPNMAMAAAVKFYDLIDAEMAFMVPSKNLRAQTEVQTLGGSMVLERGTVGGEALYSITQFRTFPVIALLQLMHRSLYGRGNMNKLSYAMTLPILLTLGGVFAEQAHQIAQGKDPLPMDEKLLGRGMMRGGGLGLLGDILGSSIQNDRGNTFAGFVTGPTASTFVDPALNLTAGNFGEVLRDEETNAGRELSRFFKNNLPGGNAWYAKLALNRMLLDELDAIADPDYRNAWRRMERRAEDQGTDFWWAPGDGGPERAPQFTEAERGYR